MLYVEVMYHFNEQVDFKISSKLIQASKGYCLLNIYKGILMSAHSQWRPIANTCANVSLCMLNFTVIPHIRLFSPINTDVVCQEKRH